MYFELIGISVRVIPRPGQQLLGINGRDDGPMVSILAFSPNLSLNLRIAL
jgi:hypothetical protein